MNTPEKRTAVINTTEALNTLIAQLLTAPFVAVDTEFHRETTFWSKLCLIQIATAQGAWAIDPLAPSIDLTMFWTLLKNDAVIKVLHSARQDMEIFWEQGNVLPQNLFDTQIGVLALGYQDSMSYQSLVSIFTGKQISKTAQVTDWTRRPLRPDQLEYALDDVRYLVQVYDKLYKQLRAKKRLDWVTASMAKLSDPALYQPSIHTALRRLKPKSFDPAYLKDLACLAWCREEKALAENIPRRHVATDDLLLEWASIRPGSAQAVSQLRAFKRRQPSADFIAAALTALTAPSPLEDSELPDDKKRLSRKQMAQLEALKFLLKMQAATFEVSATLVACNETLSEIVLTGRLPESLQEGWTHEVFGKVVTKFLAGEAGIYCQDGHLSLKKD